MTKHTNNEEVHTAEMETKAQKVGEKINRSTNDDDDNPNIGFVLFLAALAAGSYYSYFAGYVVAFKRVSLGTHSFLLLAIIFSLATIWQLREYIKFQKSQKK